MGKYYLELEEKGEKRVAQVKNFHHKETSENEGEKYFFSLLFY